MTFAGRRSPSARGPGGPVRRTPGRMRHSIRPRAVRELWLAARRGSAARPRGPLLRHVPRPRWRPRSRPWWRCRSPIRWPRHRATWRCWRCSGVGQFGAGFLLFMAGARLNSRRAERAHRHARDGAGSAVGLARAERAAGGGLGSPAGPSSWPRSWPTPSSIPSGRGALRPVVIVLPIRP